MTLHIINRSSSNAVATCLRFCQSDHAIILIEDGVITATNSQYEKKLSKHKVYALKADLKARGIKAEQLITGIKQVNYNDFVKLTVDYKRTQTWN